MSYEDTIQVEPYALPYTLKKYNQERSVRVGFALMFLLTLGTLLLQRSPPIASVLIMALFLTAYALFEYDLLETRKLSVTLDGAALTCKDLKRECCIAYGQLAAIHVSVCQNGKGGVYHVLTLSFASKPFALPYSDTLNSSQDPADPGDEQLKIPLRMIVPQSRVILLHILTTHAPQATTNDLASRMASGEFSP